MKTAALVIVFIGILAAPAAAASAQPGGADPLLSSEPAMDAVILETPSRVLLEFTEAVVPGTARIQLFAGDGRPVAVEAVSTEGNVIAAPLDPQPDGRYLVAWDVETETSGAVGGGYFFTVDAAGLGAFEVDRQAGDDGGGGALRTVAAVAALLAGSLMIATLVATAIDPDAGAARLTPAAAAVFAVSAVLSVTGAVIASGVVPGNLAVPSTWGDTIGTSAGRGWIAALAGAAGVPLLLVLRRDDPRAPQRVGWRIGVAVVGLVVLVGVSVGAGRVLAVGPLVVALAFIVATGAALAWFLDQRVVAVFGAVGVVTVLFVGVFLVRSSGHSATLEGETLALEIDIQPAQQGVNEVHLYAFRSAGGIAPLVASEAWITHLPTGAGPIQVPLLRAGPNHFLTYTADLPLAGEWKVEFVAAGEDGEAAHLDTIVNVR